MKLLKWILRIIYCSIFIYFIWPYILTIAIGVLICFILAGFVYLTEWVFDLT